MKSTLNKALVACKFTFVFAGLILISPLSGKSSIIAESSFNTEGEAVMFTPQSDINFSSITLWLTGYNGLNGSTLSLSLMHDSSFYYGSPSPVFGPSDTISSGSSMPNDGSSTPFDFNVSGSLTGGTPYWLFLYLQVPDAEFYQLYWDSGPSLESDIVINGSETFINGFLPDTFQSGGEFFNLNQTPGTTPTSSVPEPSTYFSGALILIFLVASTVRKLRKA